MFQSALKVEKYIKIIVYTMVFFLGLLVIMKLLFFILNSLAGNMPSRQWIFDSIVLGASMGISIWLALTILKTKSNTLAVYLLFTRIVTILFSGQLVAAFGVKSQSYYIGSILHLILAALLAGFCFRFNQLKSQEDNVITLTRLEYISALCNWLIVIAVIRLVLWYVLPYMEIGFLIAFDIDPVKLSLQIRVWVTQVGLILFVISKHKHKPNPKTP